MRTIAMHAVPLMSIILLGARIVSAAEFNIRDYGAKANGADDTAAVRAALEACGKAGGGTVFVPAGTYLVARQASGDPILPIPSNTTVRGEGPARIVTQRAKDVVVHARPTVRFAGIVLKWVRGDREANMRRLIPMVREAAAGGAKIVCTTECFLDGYAIADKSIPLDVYQSYGEPIPGGKFYHQLAELARELKIYLVAGMHEVEHDKHYNTAVLIGPDGTLIGKYHKQKLEHELVRNQPGNQCPTFPTAYGRVGLMICADRREATIVRGLCAAGADFLICPSGGMFGPKSNDPIVQKRSRENGRYVLFVHPAEFLVTGPDGSNASCTVLGTRLLTQPGSPDDLNRVFYFDLPLVRQLQ